MKKFAVVFPGQGSQSVGMMAELYDRFEVVRASYEEASEVLGYDLWQTTSTDSDGRLNQTEVTQPALLVAGVATFRALRAAGLETSPVAMAGHSLGEYAALVASGALGFGDGVRLVQQRGQLMQAAVPPGVGSMAAILGLDDADVIAVCSEAAQGQVAEAVNFNSPGQVVIAGHAEAIERACEAAKGRGAKRALVLPVSGCLLPAQPRLSSPRPFAGTHGSCRMPIAGETASAAAGAAEQLAGVLADVNVTAPSIPVLHNVNVAVAGAADDIRAALTQQLYRPVQWVSTVRALGADFGATTVLESGPGKVLMGLNKRIDKSLSQLAVYDNATLDAALALND